MRSDYPWAASLFTLPDIVPDIVFFIRYSRNEPSIMKDGIQYRRKTFNIEEKKPLILGPTFKICMSLPPNIGQDIKGFS